MPHSRQTIPGLLFAVLLSVTAVSQTMAHPAPPTQEQIQFARQKIALEEQLADMQMKFTDENPRVVALKAHIASYDRLVTPQAEAKVKPGLLHRLRARRAALRLQLLDTQAKCTDLNPSVRNLKEQINELDQHIASVQQKRH